MLPNLGRLSLGNLRCQPVGVRLEDALKGEYEDETNADGTVKRNADGSAVQKWVAATCAICSETLNADSTRTPWTSINGNGPYVRSVCEQDHVVHTGCIKQWQAQGKTTCPECRTPILPHVLALPTPTGFYTTVDSDDADDGGGAGDDGPRGPADAGYYDQQLEAFLGEPENDAINDTAKELIQAYVEQIKTYLNLTEYQDDVVMRTFGKMDDVMHAFDMLGQSVLERHAGGLVNDRQYARAYEFINRITGEFFEVNQAFNRYDVVNDYANDAANDWTLRKHLFMYGRVYLREDPLDAPNRVETWDQLQVQVERGTSYTDRPSILFRLRVNRALGLLERHMYPDLGERYDQAVRDDIKALVAEVNKWYQFDNDIEYHVRSAQGVGGFRQNIPASYSNYMQRFRSAVASSVLAILGSKPINYGSTQRPRGHFIRMAYRDELVRTYSRFLRAVNEDTQWRDAGVMLGTVSNREVFYQTQQVTRTYTANPQSWVRVHPPPSSYEIREINEQGIVAGINALHGLEDEYPREFAWNDHSQDVILPSQFDPLSQVMRNAATMRSLPEMAGIGGDEEAEAEAEAPEGGLRRQRSSSDAGPSSRRQRVNASIHAILQATVRSN
jgi:hypothetical protein